MSVNGLPPIDQSLLPRDVRDGSPERKRSYEAALSFERVLVQQLTKTLADSAQPADDESADAATQTYRGMLPDTLADNIMSAGGLGLARELTGPEKAS
jgi:Rod binding domain-containing protein